MKEKVHLMKNRYKPVLLFFLINILSLSAIGQIDCTNIPEWEATKVYAAGGTQVKYENKVYENRWWTQGDIPSESGEWGVWNYIDDCGGIIIPPTISITSPTDGAVFIINSQVQINVIAADENGTVTQIEYFVDGSSIGTSGTWTPTSAGNYSLTAIATDNDNASTESAPVSVIVNSDGNIPPTVSITSPSSGSSYPLGTASIIITADADDADGTVSSVQFFNGTTLISTDATSPYSATIANPTIGSYVLTAVATDNDGAATTSSPVTVLVPDTTVSSEKQVIGYITQWDAWKTTTAGVPSAGAYTHLNVDMSKYTILNFSFFGVAVDGSLHGGDFRDKNIYQDGVTQAPNDLFYTDTYSSWDIFILFGETEQIQYINADVAARATAQGFEVVENGTTWSHPGWRAYNKPLPLPLHTETGAPGLLEMAHQNSVKVMASIGGWSMCKHFPEMAADPVKRQRFVDDCVLLINLGFDGIDLDWEYPGPFDGMNFTGTEADFTNFAILIEEIRTAIGPDKLITSAMSAASTKLQGYDWARVANTMDYFNMMTYDFNGGWSNIAGHNSPLYPYTGAEADFSWQRTLEALDQLGVPRNKINMGIPFYGRGVVCDGAADLNAPTIKREETVQPDGPITTCADFVNWPKDVYDGTPNYSFVKQQTGLGTTNGWTRHWDDEAKVPYLTNGTYFLSYDDVESIGLKSQYIMDNQLAGTIVWTVYGDLEFGGTVTNHGVKLVSWSDMSHELIDKVHQVFGNPVNNIPPEVALTAPDNNSVFNEGDVITVSANATDSDGAVSSVKFYSNGSLIGTDDSSPYSISWSTGVPGINSITAVATDDGGAVTTSDARTISINGGGDTTVPGAYKILMYVTSWSGDAATYDYSKVTHLNYSFSVPNADGTVPAPDNDTKLQDIVTRAHAAGVKVSLAIGGWLNSSPTNTPFETFSQTAQGRANFANSCVSLIQQYNLDGIDIDWEYPTATTRWDDLITDVRQAIGSDKLLTAAVAGGSYFGQGFGSASFQYLDWINIMSYDCSCPTNAPYSYAVEGLDYWTGRGMPINKCVLGVPFYTEDNTPALHTQKAELVKTRGAAGMMAWELANDTDGSQLDAIYTALNDVVVGSDPVSNANGPYSGEVNISIAFSSAGSSDSDGSIVSYLWDFGDNSTSSVENPTHTYSTEGTFTVTLTVTDNDNRTGTNATTATIGTTGSCTSPQYVEDNGYVDGSIVQNNGVEYQCKPYPFSGWCNGGAWAYEPGVGLYWSDAWTELGPCLTLKNSGSVMELLTNMNQVKVFPNPFNSKAIIQLSMVDDSFVELKVYSSSGKQVVSLINTNLEKGTHEVEFDATDLPSGVYLYKVLLNNQVITGNLLKK